MGLLSLRYSRMCSPMSMEKVSLGWEIEICYIIFRWRVIYVVLTTMPWREEFSHNAHPLFSLSSSSSDGTSRVGVLMKPILDVKCANISAARKLRKNKREILWLCKKFLMSSSLFLSNTRQHLILLHARVRNALRTLMWVV